MKRESDIVGNGTCGRIQIMACVSPCELACRAAVCRRHLAGGPITGNGYYYWLGVEAAGDNNFYGLDGSLFGKVRRWYMMQMTVADFSDERNTNGSPLPLS
jgi:hypothetical protein